MRERKRERELLKLRTVRPPKPAGHVTASPHPLSSFSLACETLPRKWCVPKVHSAVMHSALPEPRPRVLPAFMATAFLSSLPTHVPRSRSYTHPRLHVRGRGRMEGRQSVLSLHAYFYLFLREDRASRRRRRGEQSDITDPEMARNGAERARERCTENIYGHAVDKITGEFTQPTVVVLALPNLRSL